MPDKELIVITAADLGEPEAAADVSGSPETPNSKLRDGAGQIGHKATKAVQRASSQVARKIADTTAEASNRSAEAIREKVNDAVRAQTQATADAVEARLREVDWKSEVQKGAEGGLRWLIGRLEALADHFRSEDKSAEDDQTKA
jgi:hypothetical protein